MTRVKVLKGLTAGVARSVQHPAVHRATCSHLQRAARSENRALRSFLIWAVGGSRIWQSWAPEIRSCRSVLDPSSLWQRPQGVSSVQGREEEQEHDKGISRREEPNVKN